MNDSVIMNVVEDGIYLQNGIEINIPCDGEIWSFIELFDRVLVLANLFDVVGCNQFRNIFCYSKDTGEQLWRVEQPWQWQRVDPEGREMRKVYVEEVYKIIRIYIKQGDNKYDCNQGVDRDYCKGDIDGTIYLKLFRKDADQIRTRTLSHFPKDYTIDIDTGKVELLEVHQPSEKIY